MGGIFGVQTHRDATLAGMPAVGPELQVVATTLATRWLNLTLCDDVASS